MTEGSPVSRWVAVCPAGVLIPDRGVAARVGGELVAVFVLGDGSAFGVDERDPFTGALVMSRGIIGDADGTPTVASPIYKQRFDLRTGRCLEDDEMSVRSWPVRIHDGHVEVAAP